MRGVAFQAEKQSLGWTWRKAKEAGNCPGQGRMGVLKDRHPTANGESLEIQLGRRKAWDVGQWA